MAYLEFQAADVVALKLQSGDVKSLVFPAVCLYLEVLALHAASLELEAGGKVCLEFHAVVLSLEIHGFCYIVVVVEGYFLSLQSVGCCSG